MLAASRYARGRSIAAIFVAAIGAGCSTDFERRDWSNYEGPGAEYFKREEVVFPHVDDPLEPANRILSIFDYGIYRYILAPIAALYRNFVPGDVRKGIYNAGENLLYPTRVINSILQWKWHDAAEETSRFMVNTTVGVGGLFDPAKKIGLDPHDEDFGQTFAEWGWKDSTYFFLPLYGPSNIRDSIGKIPDEITDPLNYVFPWAYARRLNRVSDDVEEDLRLVDSYFDPYEPGRTLYTLERALDVSDFSWRREESGPTQTLDLIFLTFDEAGARKLFARCDLHAIAEGLRANDKVRVFANENDFLLRPEDIQWLSELLGERAQFFPAGGHLGNLHRKTIQQIMQRTMEKAANESS